MKSRFDKIADSLGLILLLSVPIGLAGCSRAEKAATSVATPLSEQAQKLVAYINSNSDLIKVKTLQPPFCHNGFWVSGNTGRISEYDNSKGIHGILWKTWDVPHEPVSGVIAAEKGWVFLRSNGEATISFNSYIYRLGRQSMAEAFAVKNPDKLKTETQNWKGRWEITGSTLTVKVLGENPDPAFFAGKGQSASFDISTWKSPEEKEAEQKRAAAEKGLAEEEAKRKAELAFAEANRTHDQRLAAMRAAIDENQKSILAVADDDAHRIEFHSSKVRHISMKMNLNIMEKRPASYDRLSGGKGFDLQDFVVGRVEGFGYSRENYESCEKILLMILAKSNAGVVKTYPEKLSDKSRPIGMIFRESVLPLKIEWQDGKIFDFVLKQRGSAIETWKVKCVPLSYVVMNKNGVVSEKIQSFEVIEVVDVEKSLGVSKQVKLSEVFRQDVRMLTDERGKDLFVRRLISDLRAERLIGSESEGERVIASNKQFFALSPQGMKDEFGRCMLKIPASSLYRYE